MNASDQSGTPPDGVATMANRLALVGGIAGVAVVTWIMRLRVSNDDMPTSLETVLGHLAFAVVYAAPFVLAEWARRWRGSELRTAAWAAGALVAAGLSLTAFSGVTLVLLPTAALLALAFAAEATSLQRAAAGE
jgi:hypothetical protein